MTPRRVLPTVLCAAAALLLFAPAALRADIGENSVQLYKRYGEGRYTKDFIVFNIEPYTVTVILDKSSKVSRMEIAARLLDENGKRVELDGKDPSTRPMLSEADVRAILARNASGKSWLPTKADSAARIYMRSDNEVMAIYSPSQRTVTFQSVK